MKDVKEQLKIIKRGCADLITEEELVKKLKKGSQLRIKLGMDPTSPDIHLGHSVALKKMREFQDLGHQAVLIIGDYTARVGDPSGTDKTRPMLTPEEIEENAKTYLEQAGKILDLSPEKFELKYNGEWLGQMSFAEVIKLASNMTVARMLERDSFEKRYKAGVPIGVHEFLYPLMQGYDSLMIKSDVELGGTDQTFNNLVGRDVQKAHGKEPQVVLVMPLLVGLDGVEKMSKSKGNYVGVTESPKEMFGKIMSITDDLMWNYYELLSTKSIDEIAKMKKGVKDGSVHPKDAKVALAKELIARFHNEKAAKEAAAEFDKVFAQKQLPTDIPEAGFSAGSRDIPLVDLLVKLDMVASKGEARRMIQQGGVYIDEKRMDDINMRLECTGDYIIRVGKRKFKKINFMS